MSHALGEIYYDGQVVAYFDYDGTVDYANSRLFANESDVYANCRRDTTRKCTCGTQPIDVILYSRYGRGFHWPGKACFGCGAITDGFEPEESTAGKPEQAHNRRQR